MSDSLTAIYVEPHQCPSHQPILLTQGPICESFAKFFWELAILKNIVFLSRPFWILFFKKKIFFCFFPIKTCQSLLVSKDRSKFWSSQMRQHFLTQTKHFDRECTKKPVNRENWDSFKVWNFLIFEVVKLCRVKKYLIFK